MPVTLQLAVPAAFPLPPRSLVQLTCVTPTASLAVPLRFSVPVVVAYVDEEVGPVIEMFGAVVSPAATLHANVCDVVNTPSDTVAVTV
jgi:hypothetical protein